MASRLNYSRLFRRLAFAFHATITIGYLSLCLPALSSGLPPSSDAVAFHVAGKMIAEDRGADLYDVAAQRQAEEEFIEYGFRAFLNPPTAAVLFAPLGFLSYADASRLLLVGYLLTAALAAYLLWGLAGDWTRRERFMLLSAFLASPFLISNLLMGAYSLPVFVCLLMWHRSRGGVWLALSTVKPQLALYPAASLVGRRRAALWFAGVCLLIFALTLPLVGWRAWLDYFGILSAAGGEGGEALGVLPWKMVNLKGIVLLLRIPNAGALSLAAWVAGLFFVVWLWRQNRDVDLTAALTLCLAVFLSPHSNPPDALTLFLPAVLVYRHIRDRKAERVAFLAFTLGLSAAMNLFLLMRFNELVWRLAAVLVLGLTAWVALALKSRLNSS